VEQELLTWESGFRGKDLFRNQPIKNKNGLWWPCLFTDRDKICNLYKGPSIDASYQVSVHLAEGVIYTIVQSEETFFNHDGCY
jgi:hypothetical protein